MATAGGLLMATAGDQSRLIREAWPRRLNVAKYWLLIGLGATRLHLPLLMSFLIGTMVSAPKTTRGTGEPEKGRLHTS